MSTSRLVFITFGCINILNFIKLFQLPSVTPLAIIYLKINVNFSFLIMLNNMIFNRSSILAASRKLNSGFCEMLFSLRKTRHNFICKTLDALMVLLNDSSMFSANELLSDLESCDPSISFKVNIKSGLGYAHQLFD